MFNFLDSCAVEHVEYAQNFTQLNASMRKT